jgi:two-component system, cell cycle sensor histidine kinase and response regulator CckA
MLNLELASDVVSRLAPGRERDELSRTLDSAREGSERVRRIVRSLASLGREDDEPHAPVNVHQAIDAALRILEGRYRHRARPIREYSATRLVLASEYRLGQVFVNLIANAADAIAEGDVENNSIRLTTADAADGRVTIDVADSGCGIDPAIVDRMFEPFFTTKPVGAGSGLGLSICHGIVTAFGGELALLGTAPGGSVFRVTIPAAQRKQPSAAPRAEEQGAPKQAPRVLVVDDEPAVGQIIARALESYAVTVTGSGADARVLCDKERFDVILCDVTMPDFDGIDLWEALHAAGRGVECRMAFMTGGAHTQRAREFLSRIPNRTIEKPFGLASLEELVQAVLSDHR